MPIRRSRRLVPAVPIVLALAALTSCASAPPPPPITSTRPVFENEEQALAAVTAAYEEYLRLSNLILLEGGASPDRIDVIVGSELAAFEHESLVELAVAGKTLVGAPTLVSMQVTEWYSAADAAGVLAVASACINLSEVQVYNAEGISTVREDRPETRTWALKLGPGEEHQSSLIIISLDALAEGPSCVGS